MKMKRYFAPDMRQAIRRVREDQGPNSVILSNRRVPGGVEIIAALDYDEALVNQALGAYENNSRGEGEAAEVPSGMDKPYPGENIGDPAAESSIQSIRNDLKALRDLMEAPLLQFGWGEMRKVQPLRANLLKRLMALGLDATLCREIVDKVVESGRMENGWAASLKLLAEMLPVSDDDILSEGGVIALVGSTGVGKTTTVAKLAARFALRHGRRHVALITTDSYRIGAHEQLRTYGRILGIPVQTAGDKDELAAALNHARDRKLVLIDTAGVSQRDMHLTEKLSSLNTGGQEIHNYLVLSATSQAQVQSEVIRSFQKSGLQRCILTKIDEAGSLGGTLATLAHHGLPAAYVSDGQKVPDDLHPARGEKLVKHAVELMQQRQEALTEDALAFNFGGLVANAHV
ncbi:flagellar biosynthesis protein FlhF [Thiolapillus brandeum]|uniref:Flagellar biosynthesis protein FlhF n=1 Tax=Thiolapillus brandeum TaxID=1076588 RepID=A0A7U6GIN0_9GAMM|nr:flagellar biosynthesis protein FlhF [Thiolapillus brandeum]BAO44322.1 flagellar biosynthesis protein FlhF [Thiolapillus brandeum]